MTKVFGDTLYRLQGSFEARQAARFAVNVSGRIQSADLQNGLAPRLGPRQTAALVLLRQQLEMGRQLFVKLPIELSAANDRKRAREGFPGIANHAMPPLEVVRTRPITEASRSQLAASAASAFSPARVSE